MFGEPVNKDGVIFFREVHEPLYFDRLRVPRLCQTILEPTTQLVFIVGKSISFFHGSAHHKKSIDDVLCLIDSRSE